MIGFADVEGAKGAGAVAPPIRAAAADGAAVLIAAMFAALLQLPHPALPDVGWLALCAERLLAGDALYSDVVEVNPPMSVFIYVPLVLLRQATGLPLVPALIALVTAFSLLSILLAAHILRRAGLLGADWRWPAAASAVLLVAPLGAFGQREHVAAIALLPFLAAVCVRASGGRVGLLGAVLAGLGGGLGMSVKPHFVLAGALPVLYALARTRSFRAIKGPENWVAGFFLVAYAGVIAFLYPSFLHTWLPILQDTYRAVRIPFGQLLVRPETVGLIAAIGGAAVALGRGSFAARPAVFALAGFGFFAAALEQGKMWNNHLYPALAMFFLVALGDAFPRLLERRSPRERIACALGLVMVAVGSVGNLVEIAARPATTVAFAPRIEALVPYRPTMFALSGSIAAGNPLAAEVGAAWTGAPFGQWLFQFSDHRLRSGDLDPATRERLRRYMELDRASARTAVAEGRPDFILVDRVTFDWYDWAFADPALRATLEKYTPIEETAGVELWARQDLLLARETHRGG